jgi:hypothetical protein
MLEIVKVKSTGSFYKIETEPFISILLFFFGFFAFFFDFFFVLVAVFSFYECLINVVFKVFDVK